MARVQSVLAAVQRCPQEHLPSDEAIDQISSSLNPNRRDRVLTPKVMLWLFGLQILHANTAINHLRHLSGIQFRASSYCHARKELSLEFLKRVAQRQIDDFHGRNIKPGSGDAPPPPGDSRYEGRRVKLCDCTTFSMPDVPELREQFGLPAGQEPGIGYPVAKPIALVDHASGMLTRIEATHNSTHDMAAVTRIHPGLETGDILVADAAYCSFAHLCLLASLQVDAVFCLHQRRIAKAGLQRWQKPPAGQRPDWMAPEVFARLPQHVDIRVVKHCIRQKGFRTQVVYIATTLLDVKRWPDREIARLYGLRWNIETCFEHIKTTMNMNVLKCRSLDGVLKEMTMYMIVYNMIRRVMLRAASNQRVDPSRISFIDAMRMLGAVLTGGTSALALVVNPCRPGRLEPRVRRRRPKNHPLMTKPRHHLKAAIFAAKIA